ncbi:GIY-YIG nuclease family protein [bacterium]|nr:GIY-YIG nuclease family protein [bacterium]MDB4489687.1 GIY-YIG nuclease family protein [bacterium]
MKRITEHESKTFIPLKENYGNTGIENAAFFTITPSERGEGWEDVTYYTEKKYGLYADQGEGDQWVYVLSNPSLPKEYLKIGYTKLKPEERATQISSATGVPTPYKVEWAYKCFNGEMVERMTHEKLKSFRVNNRKEFFHISLEEAKDNIILIGSKFK